MCRLIALILTAAAIGGCAATPESIPDYPARDCGPTPENGKSGEVECIARLLPPTQGVVERAHVAGARLEKNTDGEICIPRRYLELWNRDAREESEAICGMPEGTLAYIGRYFDCMHTREDGCPRPNFGVALEGGGSKSAPFSLGVLAGLQRSGVLPAVDIIGSASGGSYAAYFYFARLMERWREPAGSETPSARYFRDCMPSLYRRNGVVPAGLLPDSELCKELDLATGVFRDLVEGNEFESEFPYQYQAKAGRDLLSLKQGMRLRSESENYRDYLPAATAVSLLAVAHAATVVPHIFTHALFDMPFNYSPSREAYRAGIERAYGYSAADWREALRREDFWFTEPPPNDRWIGTRFVREWKMADLERAYVDVHTRCDEVRAPCDFPLWTLSTVSSAGRSRDFWVRPQPRDFQRFSFELGPRGHGSGLLGFLDVPPNMTLRSAVGASSAFLDDQQRAIGDNTVLRTIASAGIFFANLNWGTNIANFNTSDAKRASSSLTPFPGYWLSAFQGLRAGHIHLADGGNVDNLGLVPMLRRGVRNIVVSASTEDLEGQFPALCKMKNELELQVSRDQQGHRDVQSVYNLLAPALGKLDRVCNLQLGKQELSVWGRDAVRALVCSRLPEEKCDDALQDRILNGEIRETGYDFWNWPAPVIEACVVRRRNPAVAEEAGADTCEMARNDKPGREISRLYMLKPALASPGGYKEQMDERVIRWCSWVNDPLGSIARGLPPAGSTIPPGMDLPCATLAYVSSVPPAEGKCHREHHDFPQDNFIGMTVHSAYTLYGAYYDLARHRASQIRLAGKDLDSPNSYRGAPIPPCEKDSSAGR